MTNLPSMLMGIKLLRHAWTRPILRTIRETQHVVVGAVQLWPPWNNVFNHLYEGTAQSQVLNSVHIIVKWKIVQFSSFFLVLPSQRRMCLSIAEIKQRFLLALIFCLKPSPASFTTWCQPGGIQSQKWYHEWCIRWKNAFTLASTQRAVVANTVMEKYEGYSNKSASWNQENISERCLIQSKGDELVPEPQLWHRFPNISI